MSWCSERTMYGGGGVASLSLDGQWTLQANCAWMLRA